MIQWLLLAVFLFFPISVSGHAQPLNEITVEPMLRVGILTNQQSVEISAEEKFSIISAGAGKIVGTFGANDKVTIAIGPTGFTINTVPVDASGLDIAINSEPTLSYVEQSIAVNKRYYRGSVSLHRTIAKPGITVVNTLPLEQYLYGVIRNEISPEWSMEAVKAQAVAARTYALTNNTKHQADGFDVCATTDCQVYGGQNSEAPRAIEAVDATRGLVLTYKGELINALFHSSSGGYTENSENVWAATQPYLRGVVDYDQNSPYFKWEKKLTVAELNQAIMEAGYNIGLVQAIELSPLTSRPILNFDRGVSGRVKSVYFIGKYGNIQIPGTKLRNMLHLKSTLFDITIVKNYPEITLPAGKDRNHPLPPGISSLVEKKSSNPPANLEPTDFVVITGSGWGHGLGLSQWGAKAMAEMGPPGNTEYFKNILKHYYQDVEIKKAYK